MLRSPGLSSTSRARQPGRLLIATLLLAGIAQMPTPPTARAQAVIYVNTTGDPTGFLDECQTLIADCSLRGAIERARFMQGGAVVTACFDSAVVPGAPPCPTGVKPLTARDRGWDAASGRFFIRPVRGRPFVLVDGGVLIDFRQGVGNWSGPADNRIIVDYTGTVLEAAFRIPSSNNALSGLEIRGAFERGAIFVPGGAFGERSEGNQIGPGVVLANITRGPGIFFTNDLANNNRVFGNWCGINGDGTNIAPVHEDCVKINEGSFGNVIGDLAPENRNVFASTVLGGGIFVHGSEARGNRLQGNWFGLDAAGNAPAQQLKSGIQLVDGPTDTIIELNVISGNDNAGIAIFDAAEGTIIRNNHIGTGPDGIRCVENVGYGISMQGGPFQTLIESNSIQCNRSGGVLMAGQMTRDNRLTKNIFSSNGGHPIHVIQGSNRGVTPPLITAAAATEVRGTTCANCTVEIFSDHESEALSFEGTATADGDGNWVYSKAGGLAHRFVTATTTMDGNTSALASHVEVDGVIEPSPSPATASPTPSDHTATPTGTDEPIATATATPSETTPVSSIFLPWAGREATFDHR